MRFNVRYDDGPQTTSRSDLCSVDFYVNTRDDLIAAQNLINALLNILPAKSNPEAITP